MSDVIAQINAKKRRRSPFDREDTTSDELEILDQVTRIANEIKDLKRAPSEQWKLVPIGLVTCLENATRWSIKSLVDHGEPFASQAKNLKIKSLNIDDIMGMIGDKVTGGELVAHLVSVNRMTDINKNISCLLGTDLHGKQRDFWDEIKRLRIYDYNVYNPKQGDDESVPLLIKDAAASHIALEYIFEIRHIIVHEIVAPERLRTEKIKTATPLVCDFIFGMMNFIHEQISPGYTSLTQYALTQASIVSLSNIVAEHESALEKLELQLDGEKKKALSQSEEKWNEYVNAELNFFTNPFAGGTGATMIENGFLNGLYKDRIARIYNHIESLKGWEAGAMDPEVTPDL